MEQVNVKINGVSYEVPADSTILEAARYAGVDIPTLCYLKDVNQIGAVSYTHLFRFIRTKKEALPSRRASMLSQLVSSGTG